MIEDIKKKISYDSNSGVFMWISGHKKGKVAGNISKKGYLRIKVFQKEYRAHRLAWMYVYGETPNGDIDHINHNKLDNRIANLRKVTSFDNMQNQKLFRTNKSGHHGVCWHKRDKVWCVSVCHNGKSKHLGNYTSLEEAIEVRKRADLKLGFHYNHGRAYWEGKNK